MASLWTGLYPQRTGVLRHGHALSEEARLPAEILRDAGYRTAGLWRNGWVAPNFGFDQGFETYHRPRPAPLPLSVRRDNPSIRLEGSDMDVLDGVRGFLRSYGEEPWFLYLHLMDVHQYVYSESTALFGTDYSDIYDNSIRWTDALIRAIADELYRRELLDRTLIAIASDHGEAFGEHGLEGHARDLHAEVIEVPFIVSFPFQLEPPGLVIDISTANVDVWPTLLDVLGLPELEDPAGISLVPAMLARARGEHLSGTSRETFAQLDLTWGRTQLAPQPLVSIQAGSHRMMVRLDDRERLRLFDLRGDPDEQQNVASRYPEVVAKLREGVNRYLERPAAAWGEAPEVAIDEMMLNQLRALGYEID